jgi:hypothetical protein
MASILVWSEDERLQLNEIADQVILYLHVSDNSIALWSGLKLEVQSLLKQ